MATALSLTTDSIVCYPTYAVLVLSSALSYMDRSFCKLKDNGWTNIFTIFIA